MDEKSHLVIIFIGCILQTIGCYFFYSTLNHAACTAVWLSVSSLTHQGALSHEVQDPDGRESARREDTYYGEQIQFALGAS